MTIIFPVVAAAPVLKVANPIGFICISISIAKYSNYLWSLKKIVDAPLLLLYFNVISSAGVIDSFKKLTDPV
jgi:hypothetical protein